MDHRLVALPLQLHQQPPDMPLGLSDLFGSLTLGDQPLLGFLQSDQPISISLGHEKCS